MLRFDINRLVNRPTEVAAPPVRQTTTSTSAPAPLPAALNLANLPPLPEPHTEEEEEGPFDDQDAGFEVAFDDAVGAMAVRQPSPSPLIDPALDEGFVDRALGLEVGLAQDKGKQKDSGNSVGRDDEMAEEEEDGEQGPVRLGNHFLGPVVGGKEGEESSSGGRKEGEVPDVEEDVVMEGMEEIDDGESQDGDDELDDVELEEGDGKMHVDEEELSAVLPPLPSRRGNRNRDVRDSGVGMMMESGGEENEEEDGDAVPRIRGEHSSSFALPVRD